MCFWGLLDKWGTFGQFGDFWTNWGLSGQFGGLLDNHGAFWSPRIFQKSPICPESPQIVQKSPICPKVPKSTWTALWGLIPILAAWTLCIPFKTNSVKYQPIGTDLGTLCAISVFQSLNKFGPPGGWILNRLHELCIYPSGPTHSNISPSGPIWAP